MVIFLCCLFNTTVLVWRTGRNLPWNGKCDSLPFKLLSLCAELPRIILNGPLKLKGGSSCVKLGVIWESTLAGMVLAGYAPSFPHPAQTYKRRWHVPEAAMHRSGISCDFAAKSREVTMVRTFGKPHSGAYLFYPPCLWNEKEEFTF